MVRRAVLPHFALLLSATLLAPLAAVAAGFSAIALSEGEVGGAVGILLLFPIIIMTIFGLYAYFVAVIPTLVLGLTLSLIAGIYPVVRSKLIWVTVGAASGAMIGLFLMGMFAVLPATAAGAAGAFAYRIIVGWSHRWMQAGLGSG